MQFCLWPQLVGKFLGFKRWSKQRERRKTQAEKGRQEKKEEETWTHEKPPPFRCFFLANLQNKTWICWDFWTNLPRGHGQILFSNLFPKKWHVSYMKIFFWNSFSKSYITRIGCDSENYIIFCLGMTFLENCFSATYKKVSESMSQ